MSSSLSKSTSDEISLKLQKSTNRFVKKSSDRKVYKSFFVALTNLHMCTKFGKDLMKIRFTIDHHIFEKQNVILEKNV